MLSLDILISLKIIM